MKRASFSIVVLFVILHPKISFLQDGRPFYLLDIAQHIYTSMQTITPSDGFYIEDHVIDLSDGIVNEKGKKNFSFKNIVFTTIYFVARSFTVTFLIAKWIPPQ